MSDKILKEGYMSDNSIFTTVKEIIWVNNTFPIAVKFATLRYSFRLPHPR